MSKLRCTIVTIVFILLITGCSKNLQTGLAEPTKSVSIATPSATAFPHVDLESEAAQTIGLQQSDRCFQCHTNQRQLEEMTKSEKRSLMQDGWLVWELSRQNPWERVYVDGERFSRTVHGRIACTDCHGGVQSEDMETAHQGIVRNPSAEPNPVCGRCHPDIVSANPNNLHFNLNGMWLALENRSMPSNESALRTAFDRHCGTCHTTCGECHVSQPDLIGGGLIQGHLFSKTPSMVQNCVPCHANRVGAEYYGKNAGMSGDVHFVQGGMTCIDCHLGEDLHGQPAQCANCHTSPATEQVPPPDHRFASVQSPKCETCHVSVITGQDGVIMHQMHGGNLSCQVCHSIAYTQCEGCHVALNLENGDPYYELDSSYLALVIGRNPIPSYQRPYQIVTLRHVPIEPDSFGFYGANLLPDFNQRPTWTYTAPHNIQRNTPQAESCNACHGNSEWFLTEEKISSDEVEANRNILLPTIPSPILSAEQLP